jgi:hypothetical protein
VAFLPARQVGEGTFIHAQGRKSFEQQSAPERIQALMDFGSEQQFALFEIPDQKQIQSFSIQPVAANNEVLLRFQRMLEPGLTVGRIGIWNRGALLLCPPARVVSRRQLFL